MRYLALAAFGVLLIHMLSFAAYNWRNKNRLGAAGAVILGVVAVILGYILLFVGNYEL